jgi:A/G-specific adenine glycosylase
MLQQTQTHRVIPYWERWMKLWPGPSDLAAASLENVLREWNGLGYNRRAKKLHDCAREIAVEHKGVAPKTPDELILLPGIGAYTAGAVACFAWGYPAVFIETNIRAVFIHFFFKDKTGINDKELLPILEMALNRKDPKTWYWALMDYGAELKKITKNPGRKSAHYYRQSRFKGSFRQVRGELIRALSGNGPQHAGVLQENIMKKLPDASGETIYQALGILEKESLVAEENGIYRIK